MRRRSPAKSAASPPPAPGRISRRHGRSANGCLGVRDVARALERTSSCVLVAATSSAARSRSSSSVVGSSRRAFNSSREFLVCSHSLNAAAVPCSSPIRLARLASKLSDVCSLSLACSCDSNRALLRRAGENAPVLMVSAGGYYRQHAN